MNGQEDPAVTLTRYPIIDDPRQIAMPNSVLNVFIKLHALIRFRFLPVLIECLAVFLDELDRHFLMTDILA